MNSQDSTNSTDESSGTSRSYSIMQPPPLDSNYSLIEVQQGSDELIANFAEVIKLEGRPNSFRFQHKEDSTKDFECSFVVRERDGKIEWSGLNSA